MCLYREAPLWIIKKITIHFFRLYSLSTRNSALILTQSGKQEAMSHRLGIVTYRPDPSDVAKMREASSDPSYLSQSLLHTYISKFFVIAAFSSALILTQRGTQEAMEHRSGEHRGLGFGERRPLAKHSLLSTDGVRRTYVGPSRRNSDAMIIGDPANEC